MSLLEDLKRQAKLVTETKEAVSNETEKNFALAQAKFKEVFRYLGDLANSLNLVNPIVLRRYHIETSTVLENLKQHDYKVNKRIKVIDNHDYIDEVVLRFRSSSDIPLILDKKTQAVIQRFREHLWSYNLKFECKEIRNDRGYVEAAKFTVIPKIPGLIVFRTDVSQKRMKISIKNLELLGELSFEHDLEEITPEFMDELSKYILAKSNKFRTLGKPRRFSQASQSEKSNLGNSATTN